MKAWMMISITEKRALWEAKRFNQITKGCFSFTINVLSRKSLKNSSQFRRNSKKKRGLKRTLKRNKLKRKRTLKGNLNYGMMMISQRMITYLTKIWSMENLTSLRISLRNQKRTKARCQTPSLGQRDNILMNTNPNLQLWLQFNRNHLSLIRKRVLDYRMLKLSK